MKVSRILTLILLTFRCNVRFKPLFLILLVVLNLSLPTFAQEVENQKPVMVNTIPAQVLNPGTSTVVDVSSYFRDPDGDTLAYAAWPNPNPSSVVRLTRNGSQLTIISKAEGSATVIVRATDPGGLQAFQRISVSVTTTPVENQMPLAVNMIPAQVLTQGTSTVIDVSVYFRDPDADTLAYAAWPNPNPSSVVRLTRNGSQLTIISKAEGSATVIVRATDPGGLRAFQRISVSVTANSDVLDVVDPLDTTDEPKDVPTVSDKDEASWMPDPNLRKMVRNVLGLQEGDMLTQQALQRLTRLSTHTHPPDGQITDITGLEHATRLTTLGLSDMSISDITPLAGLTSLTWLGLTSNSISDIAPLAGLTALTSFQIYGNQVSDITPLKGLTALTHINLGKNQVSNITPLRNLTVLRTLWIYENQISDISPLRNLTTLRTLSLSDNQISDVSPLENLTSLTLLQLWSNPIADYEPLRRLTEKNPEMVRGFVIPEENVDLGAAPSAVPMTTVLLSNYPNPFNPETWIPYQLAKDAEVTVTIYASNGHVVRRLALGHQVAGMYQSRSRAAYWDGKNAFGESVASGLYFYTLTAGDFTATRKMLIRK